MWFVLIEQRFVLRPYNQELDLQRRDFISWGFAYRPESDMVAYLVGNMNERKVHDVRRQNDEFFETKGMIIQEMFASFTSTSDIMAFVGGHLLDNPCSMLGVRRFDYFVIYTSAGARIFEAWSSLQQYVLQNPTKSFSAESLKKEMRDIFQREMAEAVNEWKKAQESPRRGHARVRKTGELLDFGMVFADANNIFHQIVHYTLTKDPTLRACLETMLKRNLDEIIPESSIRRSSFHRAIVVRDMSIEDVYERVFIHNVSQSIPYHFTPDLYKKRKQCQEFEMLKKLDESIPGVLTFCQILVSINDLSNGLE